jgi:acetate kinase
MRDAILILNAGSSSIKLTLFDGDLTQRLTGMADGIGGTSRLRIGEASAARDLPDHPAALKAVFEGLSAQGVALDDLRAVGHRVVHGGSLLTAPRRITPETRAEIAACIPLAPLHNPHNLAAIDSVAQLAPDLPQFASFDTSFHGTMPVVAASYALPLDYSERGIRRYGFHGLSYSALVRNLPELTGRPVPARLLACHLGNGASLCAIREGRSVATTMGYSPLEGLTMGTRSGSIDPNAVLRLVEDEGLEATRRLLNHGSGLLGLSGLSSDMRTLTRDDRPESAFAIAHFCYWAARHAGSMAAAMGGCDAIVFTGGIGENAAGARGAILDHLRWLGVEVDEERNAGNGPRLHAEGSQVEAWVIAADEEREIARDALRLLRQDRTPEPAPPSH